MIFFVYFPLINVVEQFVLTMNLKKISFEHFCFFFYQKRNMFEIFYFFVNVLDPFFVKMDLKENWSFEHFKFFKNKIKDDGSLITYFLTIPPS